jgi:hypothetical protein
MTDWVEHDGGPQPVADDVWVEVQYSMSRLAALSEVQYWNCPRHFRVLNQHLIDAARLEGIRLGLEAAAREAEIGDICLLDPATIAKEADQ